MAAFIRQHTHDVRNHLNGMDLEAALLAELVSDPEAAESVSRVRGQIRNLAASLRALSTRLAEPQPQRGPIAAAELFSIWQEQAAPLGLEIAWSTELGSEQVNVDATAIAGVLHELLVNAKVFRSFRLMALARASREDADFELREGKEAAVDPGDWGRSPFFSTKRGGYGLGLWEAGRVVAANGGAIERHSAGDATLVTVVRFPLERGQ